MSAVRLTLRLTGTQVRLTDPINVDELLDNKPKGDPLVHWMQIAHRERMEEERRKNAWMRAMVDAMSFAKGPLIVVLEKPTTPTSGTT